MELSENYRRRGIIIDLAHKLPPKPFNVHWKDRTVSFWHSLHRIAADLDKLLEMEKNCINLKQKLVRTLTVIASDFQKALAVFHLRIFKVYACNLHLILLVSSDLLREILF